MKIITVCMSRNEEYHIESFVRYCLTFSDQVVIFDHLSTDGMPEILKLLKKELKNKLVLYKLKHEEISYNQLQITNQMIDYAYDELKADMVIPLDTDEFPYVEGKVGKVRERFESLDKNKYYEIRWMPFLLADSDDKSVFVPFRYKHKSKLPVNHSKKVVYFKDIRKKYNLGVSMGNHFVVNKDDIYRKTNSLESEVISDMYYAHYRYKDVDQYESKIVNGWLTNYIRKDYGGDEAKHWKQGYDKILEKYSLDKDDVNLKILGDLDIAITKKEMRKYIETFDPKKVFPNIKLKYANKILNKPKFTLLMETALNIADNVKDYQKQIDDFQYQLKIKDEEIAIKEAEINNIKNSNIFKLMQKIAHIKDIVSLKKK